MVKTNGLNCMVTMQSWMFLSSFEKMRCHILKTKDIVCLMHMENMVLGIAFGTAVTIFKNAHTHGYKGTYNQIKLCDIENEVPKTFPVSENRFSQVSTDNFSKIPGAPVAYWVSERFLQSFVTGIMLGKIADSKQGLATSDNDKFVRFWYEPSFCKLTLHAHDATEAVKLNAKWVPYNKGGNFRKWYGNNEFVVNWENNGYEIKHLYDKNGKLRSRPQNTQYYFRESGSWSLISSSVAAFRYKPYGHIFDVAGMSFFSDDNLYFLLGLCNSVYTMQVLAIVAPTINYQCGDIANIPVKLVLKENVEKKVSDNILLSRNDWDSFETSWDFKKHPMI